jgi:hypothetical protein
MVIGYIRVYGLKDIIFERRRFLNVNKILDLEREQQLLEGVKDYIDNREKAIDTKIEDAVKAHDEDPDAHRKETTVVIEHGLDTYPDVFCVEFTGAWAMGNYGSFYGGSIGRRINHQTVEYLNRNEVRISVPYDTKIDDSGQTAQIEVQKVNDTEYVMLFNGGSITLLCVLIPGVQYNFNGGNG